MRSEKYIYDPGSRIFEERNSDHPILFCWLTDVHPAVLGVRLRHRFRRLHWEFRHFHRFFPTGASGVQRINNVLLSLNISLSRISLVYWFQHADFIFMMQLAAQHPSKVFGIFGHTEPCCGSIPNYLRLDVALYEARFLSGVIAAGRMRVWMSLIPVATSKTHHIGYIASHFSDYTSRTNDAFFLGLLEGVFDTRFLIYFVFTFQG